MTETKASKEVIKRLIGLENTDKKRGLALSAYFVRYYVFSIAIPK